MKGVVLAIIAALLWGIAPILDKIALSNGVSIYTATLVRLIGAVIAILAVSIPINQVDFTGFDLKRILLLLIAGAIAGAIAMIFYYSALRILGASRTVPLTAIYPMFTALFSFLFLGESVSIRLIIGVVLIVIGIVLVSEA